MHQNEDVKTTNYARMGDYTNNDYMQYQAANGRYPQNYYKESDRVGVNEPLSKYSMYNPPRTPTQTAAQASSSAGFQ